MNLNPLIRSVTEQELHVLDIVIRQNGEIVAEHDFVEEKRAPMWSVSKTFTSMAVGIAQGEGFFKVSDPLYDYFDVPAGDLWSRLTIRDLLCMGTGQEKCPFAKAWHAKRSLDDAEGIFFSEPLVYEPGTHFMYNNAATYMLSKLISLRTGSGLNDYLRPRIFEPLGIRDVRWEHNAEGVNYGCTGLYLSRTELSKFGQLLLDEGTWEQRSLIPRVISVRRPAGRSIPRITMNPMPPPTIVRVTATRCG
jgi:CubicO group peptidase (beta-lactamase class C family)